MKDLHGVLDQLDNATHVEVYRSLSLISESVIQDVMIYNIFNGEELIKEVRVIKHLNDGRYDYHAKSFSYNVNYMIDNGVPLEFHQDDRVWGKDYIFRRNFT